MRRWEMILQAEKALRQGANFLTGKALRQGMNPLAGKALRQGEACWWSTPEWRPLPKSLLFGMPGSGTAVSFQPPATLSGSIIWTKKDGKKQGGNTQSARENVCRISLITLFRLQFRMFFLFLRQPGMLLFSYRQLRRKEIIILIPHFYRK